MYIMFVIFVIKYMSIWIIVFEKYGRIEYIIILVILYIDIIFILDYMIKMWCVVEFEIRYWFFLINLFI